PVRWLLGFVADLPDFAEQLTYIHSRERLKQRRDLCGHLGDVAGDLAHPGGVAVAGRNDCDLVDVREWTRQRAHHFRQAGEYFVDHRGLVVFLGGLGLHVHSFGLGLALLEDDLGFGFALLANRRSVAFGFRHEALLLGLGDGLDALTLDLGLLQHSRDEFL